MRKLLLFLISWIGFGALSSYSQASFGATLVFDGQALDVQNNFKILEDRSQKLTAEKVFARLSEFRRPRDGELAKGYSNAAYWIYLEIENKSLVSDVTLTAVYPVVELQTYRIDPFPHELQETDGRRSGAMLSQAPRSVGRYLVRATSSQFLNLQLLLKRNVDLVEEENSENMLLSLIFGVFMTAFLTNFLMFLLIRQRGYLYYLLFSVVNCHLAFIAIKFPASIAEWGGLDWNLIGSPYSTVGVFTTFLFVRNFLNTKKEFPRLDRAMLFYMFGVAVIGIREIISFTPGQAAFADQYYQIGVILLVTAGVKSFRRGFYPSRFYLLALLFFLIGIVIFLSLPSGFLKLNAFTLNALLIGQTCEMVLMSIALSSKLKIMEREAAQSLFKTQVLRQISHDLMNSIAIIKMSTDYAHTIGIDKSRGQVLRAAGSIEDIVKQVHDRSLIQIAGDEKEVLTTIDEVFSDLSFAYEERARQKKIRICFRVLSSDLKINMNRSTLSQQILGNILSNAIKFSEPGTDISVTADARGSRHVQISVRDRGQGIPSPRILEMLREDGQIPSHIGTAGEKGLGIGLSIVKNCLRDYRGTLQIRSVMKEESVSNHGTTFTVVIRRNEKLWVSILLAIRQSAHRLKAVLRQARV
ncbi:MAG: sensor histidine kinase [Bdellovibrionota bacterium]